MLKLTDVVPNILPRIYTPWYPHHFEIQIQPAKILSGRRRSKPRPTHLIPSPSNTAWTPI